MFFSDEIDELFSWKKLAQVILLKIDSLIIKKGIFLIIFNLFNYFPRYSVKIHGNLWRFFFLKKEYLCRICTKISSRLHRFSRCYVALIFTVFSLLHVRLRITLFFTFIIQYIFFFYFLFYPSNFYI